MIKLSQPVYVIRSNQKHNLYLSFTNKHYFKNKKIGIAQNQLDCALYFIKKEDAEQFLENYFIEQNNTIKEYNKKFYKVQEINLMTYPIDESTEFYNISCYYSSDRFQHWINNPNEYELHLN